MIYSSMQEVVAEGEGAAPSDSGQLGGQSKDMVSSIVAEAAPELAQLQVRAKLLRQQGCDPH